MAARFDGEFWIVTDRNGDYVMTFVNETMASAYIEKYDQRR